MWKQISTEKKLLQYFPLIALTLPLDFEKCAVRVRSARIPSIFVPKAQNCYTAKEMHLAKEKLAKFIETYVYLIYY